MRYHEQAVGADPEDTARATLASMQARLASGPYATLDIPPNATEAEARSAFLQLTKQFHPARFSRMSPEVQRLSNEIFLAIKGAHEALAKTSGWATRGAPNGSQPPAQRFVATTPGTQPGVAARGTGARPIHPLPGAPTAAPAQPPRAVQPVQAARSGPMAQPAAAQRPVTPANPPAATRPPAPSPAAPSTRATTPSGAGVARPTTPVPAITRPTTPTTPTTPTNAPASRAAPVTVQPWKPSASGATRAASPVPGAPSAARPAPGAFDERAEFANAMELMRRKEWPAAREALQSLAARVPTSARYKALLAYSRGREAEMAGRIDDAILEFQRALQVDPNLSYAKTAIAELQTRRK